MSKKSAEEIKQKVKQMKESRMNKLNADKNKEKARYERNQNLLKKMHEKMRSEKYGESKYDVQTSYVKNSKISQFSPKFIIFYSVKDKTWASNSTCESKS